MQCYINELELLFTSGSRTECLKSRKDMITRLYYVRMMNIEADGALLC